LPSYITPKINTEYVFYISLISQLDTKLFQTNPTLAAGDVKVSTDGGAKSNIATLPVVTPAGSDQVKVTLSTAEMNGDNITVTFADVAGAEWASVTINIQTTANRIDDLAAAVWANATRSLTSLTGFSLSNAGIDAIFTRPSVNYETVLRSLGGAVAKLVNRLKTNTVTGKLEIYKSDDLNTLGEQTQTLDSSAAPTVELNTD
jgi:hypothetical protein